MGSFGLITSVPFSWPGDVTQGAADLRAQPQLAGELRLHQATVATLLYNVDRLEFRLRQVSELNR